MEPAVLILRRLLAILVLAVLHLATSIYFVTMAFMDGVSRLDLGRPQGTGQRLTAAMARILTFPLVWLLDLFPATQGNDRPFVVLLVCGNSVLWGAVVYAGFRWIVRRIKARRVAQPTSPAPNP
ncbi:MAG: hypothetical protein ABI836_02895 [Gemmatimonadota bacterium]